MDIRTERHLFDDEGNVSGWDDVQTWRIEVNNTRAIPVKVEVRRNFDTPSWEITDRKGDGDYEKIDKDTVAYTFRLPPATRQEIAYVLTLHRGRRAD
jgi:hypothetical protein